MKKAIIMILAIVMVFAFVSCGKKADSTTATTATTPAATTTTTTTTTATTPAATTTPAAAPAAEAKYVRGDDEEIYAAVLGDYEALLDEAKNAATDSERFVIYARAEAYLLDSAVMIPTTTQNGAYTISRIAPRTVP